VERLRVSVGSCLVTGILVDEDRFVRRAGRWCCGWYNKRKEVIWQCNIRFLTSEDRMSIEGA
jgi:hypothetical protein